jgi:hypothetical protein
MTFIFVLCHTFFNDIYRKDYPSDYRPSAELFQDYLIFKFAETRIKCAVTTSEVFDKLVRSLQFFPLSNMLLAIKGFLDINELTRKHFPNLSPEEATIILATHKSLTNIGNEVILISNSEKMKEKACSLIKKLVNTKMNIKPKDLPFKILNTNEVLKYLEKEDSKIIETVKEINKKY